MAKARLPDPSSLRLARLVATLVAIAAIVVGVFVQTPLSEICHGIAVAGFVVVLVLTWANVLALRRRLRELKRPPT